MNSSKNLFRLTSGIIFLIAMFVYFLSAERTGSLWDCGEFILGAYKLQVVHPPGAPLFMLVGRLFGWLGSLISSDPSNIAFAINLMSGLFSAFTAMFVGHSTMLLSKLYFTKKESGEDPSSDYISALAGLVGGLSTAFCSSIWFSAVEGEVYAMSTFFTALTVWSVIRWYTLPDEKVHDKWLVFAAYSTGLSIGVHLLSLLTFPALALFVYFKKSKKVNFLGATLSVIAGAVTIPFIQKLIIVGTPALWKNFEIFMVNSLGMPYHSGLILTVAVIVAIFFYAFRYAQKTGNHWLHLFTIAALMVCIGYSTIGVIVIRANADTPVNMNVPSDATRLLPYLNREQYGERALVFGPHYEASPVNYQREKRYGRIDFPPFNNSTVDDSKYNYVEEKITPEYKTSDKVLFPRIGASEMGRPEQYRLWYQSMFGGNPKPSFAFNIAFFFKYQLNYMYLRYFMWNFVGKQNGDQGFYAWDKSKGNWYSGVKVIDEAKLYNMDLEPDTMRYNEARNGYFFIPFLLGLIGLLYHAKQRTKEFTALFFLFLITGIGIVLYTNQPPNEPRERDYVLVGSFFTFCIWIGLALPALYQSIKEKFKFSGLPLVGLLGMIGLSAPALMGFQNFDDIGRQDHFASRDYAKNFLYSLDQNAIIFTYGDNDTYPLWYVQEVENVRRDVRIVNLSLIAVDWYINKLRQKVNDSPPIKLTIPAEAYRGDKRNQTPFFDGGVGERPMDLKSVLTFVGNRNPVSGGPSYTFESYLPTHEMFIPVNMDAVQRLGFFNSTDSLVVSNQINITFPAEQRWITKDDLAILDVIGSNIWERPIYFATTCKNDKLLGLNDYMQYEGLALRVTPVKTISDRSLSIFGSGRVATDKVYDNMMNKFVWGNFDKKELFVDNSYGAAIQAHKMIMMRTAETLMEQGDATKAVALTDKYFEAFPHFNFPYDAGVAPFINVYIRTGQFDKAKVHLALLAEETRQFMAFYEDIDPETLQTSFGQDFRYRVQSVSSVLSMANALPDEAFKKELNDKLAAYVGKTIPN